MLRGRQRLTLASVLKAVAADFRDGRPSVVAVIAAHPGRLAELRVERLRSQGVRVLELVGLDVDAMHRELSAYSGDGMVVVDARPSFGRAQLRAFRQLFLHLDADDVWVALRSPRVPEGKQERLVALARRFEASGDGRLPRRWRELDRAVREVRVTPGQVMLEKSCSHLLKIRDDGATDLLNVREPGLQVSELKTLPAGTLVASGAMTDYPSAPSTPFPTELSYPEARLRRYDGRVSLPAASVALHGRSILPDSFRWHLVRHPVNRGVRDIDERFAGPRPDPPGEHLGGAHYFFGYNNPGHFGHLMTEALAKLWGWDTAKAEDPDLKLLCREHPLKPGTADERLEHLLLTAYDIEPDDVVWATGPVTVDRLYGVTPLWHNAPPYYVHPALRDDWRRLREGLPEVTVPPAPKIFVTRRRGNRRCHNSDAVETLFSQHGFVIVQPELLSIPEQAAVFAQARVVAGFGGSGMFNLLYDEALETVIVLNQSAYWGRSEHLFASLLGADTHFFWSDPDDGHPEGSYEAHQSPWEFDFGRHDEPLTRLLSTV